MLRLKTRDCNLRTIIANNKLKHAAMIHGFERQKNLRHAVATREEMNTTLQKIRGALGSVDNISPVPATDDLMREMDVLNTRIKQDAVGNSDNVETIQLQMKLAARKVELENAKEVTSFGKPRTGRKDKPRRSLNTTGENAGLVYDHS